MKPILLDALRRLTAALSHGFPLEYEEPNERQPLLMWPRPVELEPFDHKRWSLATYMAASCGAADGPIEPLEIANRYAALVGSPVVEIPVESALAIKAYIVAKGGQSKYVRKVWQGGRWRYFYNAAHGGGIGNTAHMVGGDKGTHFKLAGEHYKVHSASGDHVVYHKVGEPSATLRMRKDVLARTLNAEHSAALHDHFKGKHDRLRADAAKADELGNARHAARLKKQAEDVVTRARDHGVELRPKKKDAGWIRTPHGEHSAETMEALHYAAGGVRPAGPAASAARRSGLLEYDKGVDRWSLTESGRAAVRGHAAANGGEVASIPRPQAKVESKPTTKPAPKPAAEPPKKSPPAWTREDFGGHPAHVVEAAHALAGGIRPDGSTARDGVKSGLMSYDSAADKYALTDSGKALIRSHAESRAK